MDVFMYCMWVNVLWKLTQKNLGKEFILKGVGEVSSVFKCLDLKFAHDLWLLQMEGIVPNYYKGWGKIASPQSTSMLHWCVTFACKR